MMVMTMISFLDIRTSPAVPPDVSCAYVLNQRREERRSNRLLAGGDSTALSSDPNHQHHHHHHHRQEEKKRVRGREKRRKKRGKTKRVREDVTEGRKEGEGDLMKKKREGPRGELRVKVFFFQKRE